MNIVGRNDCDEVYSVIGDKEDVGFLDFDDDKSVHSFEAVDEGPVRISVPFPFVKGKPQSALIGETSADCIYVQNTTNDPIDLWSVRIFSSNPDESYILSLMKPPPDDADESSCRFFVGTTSLDDRVLQPGETLKLWLSCKPKVIGLHTSIVHFNVDDEKIERVTFLLAEDEVSRSLFSGKPYARAAIRKEKFNFNHYVAGYRPPRANNYGFKNKLLQYDIPLEIREIVEAKQVPDTIMDGLNRRNYARYFSTLLAMEEIHLEDEMRRYDMECVTMKRRGNSFLSLEVPGLAERRPSLVYGDCVFAMPATENLSSVNRPYQGYIHRVESDEIFLCFDKNLPMSHYDGKLYNVRFKYSRVNMRRLYQAVHIAESVGIELLFPSELSLQRVIKRHSFKPLNPCLNEEQACCVEMILSCKGSPPYVIHGPPGTGKTVTLVEAILQLYMTRRKARILLCAPSNSAADHVLQKLSTEVKEHEIFRLNATSRPYEDVNPNHLRFTFIDGSVFKCAPLEALTRYKIIISTYMSASLLFAEGVVRGHFSHIFLDEAGQASEPETMVPVSNLCMENTVIVLAGDHKQLGPVVHSKIVEDYGLGKSYMERLFEFEAYYGGNENYVKKLVRNYRSHPAILDLPSKLFYDGELIPCAEEKKSSIYDWDELPNKEFPVLFFGIQGCDEREGNNPSWFNRYEASKVVEVIRKLRWIEDLSESDIGIITPYRQQVLKLKKALETLDLPDLKVGSVEHFQGQEKEVIIISTVRSTVKHNEFDRIHNLGFLCNPRRFNVSITRARSLLVIIGNPHIISQDPFWDKLLWYCADNGSYAGCPLPPPQNHGYFGEQDDVVPDCFNNEVEWGEDPPRQCTGDGEWGEATSRQHTNEAEWGDNPPRQHTNEAEWGEELPKQYTNETEWGEELPKQYTNETEWGEDQPRQYTNETEWGEDLPRQYTNETEWGDDQRQYTNEAEWGEDPPRQCTNEAECGENRQSTNEAEWSEDMPQQCRDQVTCGGEERKECTNEVERPEEVPKQCKNETRCLDDATKQYTDEVEWGEEETAKHCDKEAVWGDGATGQYSKDTAHQDKSDGESSAKACSSRAEWHGVSHGPCADDADRHEAIPKECNNDAERLNLVPKLQDTDVVERGSEEATKQQYTITDHQGDWHGDSLSRPSSSCSRRSDGSWSSCSSRSGKWKASSNASESNSTSKKVWKQRKGPRSTRSTETNGIAASTVNAQTNSSTASARSTQMNDSAASTMNTQMNDIAANTIQYLSVTEMNDSIPKASNFGWGD